MEFINDMALNNFEIKFSFVTIYYLISIKK